MFCNSIAVFYLPVVCLLFLLSSSRVISISIRRLEVPSYVTAGSDVSFKCAFDISDTELFSIKWYKDGDEFYTYRPRRTPKIKLFRKSGINVDIRKSRHGNIVLRNVNLSSSGLYKCEGREDQPTFGGVSRSRAFEVVVLPEQRPVINSGRKSYQVGDVVEKKCMMAPSSPPADIKWYINSKIVPQRKIRRYQSIVTENKLHQAISGLKFVIEERHFNKTGLINITCRARISKLYDDSINQIISIRQHRNSYRRNGDKSGTHSDSYWDTEDGFSSTKIGMPVHQANSVGSKSKSDRIFVSSLLFSISMSLIKMVHFHWSTFIIVK